jgi:hypothetical protein
VKTTKNARKTEKAGKGGKGGKKILKPFFFLINLIFLSQYSTRPSLRP